MMMIIASIISKVYRANCTSTSINGCSEMTGRNDIQVGQAKISGNAMVKVKDRMFSHGTLMLNSDLGEVQNALKVNPKKFNLKVLSQCVSV